MSVASNRAHRGQFPLSMLDMYMIKMSYVDFHGVQETIIEDQIVSHSDSMRFHGMSYTI